MTTELSQYLQIIIFFVFLAADSFFYNFLKWILNFQFYVVSKEVELLVNILKSASMAAIAFIVLLVISFVKSEQIPFMPCDGECFFLLLLIIQKCILIVRS